MSEISPNSTEKTSQKTLPRWGRIIAWVALFALLIIVALVLLQRQQGPVAVGQKAPVFTLTTFDGQQIGPAEMAGKVVLVNFWASWCKPCEQEAADLESVWRDYQPQGDVLFLGIAWTDTEKASLEYIDKFDITYPNGPDLGTSISQAYRTTGVPETYIIDKNGNLAYVKLSPFTSQAEIKAAIDPLLGP
jgi:cytochrome c biogenesis protein CcmG/thiol:disulfide interchange protein DsbE